MKVCVEDNVLEELLKLLKLEKIEENIFQINEPGFDHQDNPPEVPGPEGLESELQLAVKVADKIPPTIRDKILCKKPIEMRTVNPLDSFAPEKREPVRYTWLKTIDKMMATSFIEQAFDI